MSRFAELGKKGVLVLMSDSTNSERPGMTASEKKIGESFQYLFKRAGTSRIIIATFASNIHRIQQIMDIATETGRKVAISGKSMESVVAKAIDLGYLKVKPNTMISIDHIRHYKNEQLIIVTTGSQGEPMSALKRMSTGSHRKVSITQNDFIIISATPIPGNEKFVNKVINELNVYDCNDGYHECYECPDGEECYTCPDGENCETGPGDYDYSFGVYFRSVNLDDLFPNSKFSKYSVPITSERKIGYNWKNSKDVVDAIQSIDNIWAPDHLDYSVTLTPTAIRNIKQYNKDAENYLDNSLSCDNSLFCSSKFLSSKLEDLGVTNIFRNNDTFTESRYIKPVGGNS